MLVLFRSETLLSQVTKGALLENNSNFKVCVTDIIPSYLLSIHNIWKEELY